MPAPEATRTLTAKGRQTRAALEQAARKLFAERGFHGTTLADITSAAGKSAAGFYRCFAAVQNEFRRFGMDIVAASVLRAQEHGYATDLNPEHIAAAIALLFENFTTVFVTPPGPGSLSVDISDEDAIATLSTIWKKTLYGA